VNEALLKANDATSMSMPLSKLQQLPTLQIHKLPVQQLSSIDYCEYMCNLVTERFVNTWRGAALLASGQQPDSHVAEEVLAKAECLRAHPMPPVSTLAHTFCSSTTVPWMFSSSRRHGNVVLWRLADIDEVLSGSSCATLRNYANRIRETPLTSSFVGDEGSSMFELVDANVLRLAQEAGTMHFIACYPTREVPSWLTHLDNECRTSTTLASSQPCSTSSSNASSSSSSSAITSIAAQHLLSLPYELLQLVLDACDNESLLCAASTCTSLQRVALSLFERRRTTAVTNVPFEQRLFKESLHSISTASFGSVALPHTVRVRIALSARLLDCLGGLFTPSPNIEPRGPVDQLHLGSKQALQARWNLSQSRRRALDDSSRSASRLGSRA